MNDSGFFLVVQEEKKYITLKAQVLYKLYLQLD